mgnify:CR=1 FL=1
MSPMVPMKVLGLTLDAENNAPILVLQQDGGSEILPIWIGASEALAISVALNGTRLDRPLTHETMFQAIRALDADIGAREVLAETSATRTARRGEDLVTSFLPEEPSEQVLGKLLPSLEPVSRYKM